jgi:hypothetical protein
MWNERERDRERKRRGERGIGLTVGGTAGSLLVYLAQQRKPDLSKLLRGRPITKVIPRQLPPSLIQILLNP